MAPLWVLLFVAIMLVTNVALFLGVRWAACVRRSAAGMLGGRAAWEGVSIGRRVLFTLSGPLACYATAALWFMLAASFGAETADGTRLGSVIDEGAAEGDVHSGDRVLRVAGAPVVSWDDIRARVAQAGDVVDLDVERDGSVVHVTRSKRTGGKLGISPAMHHESASAASVVTNGAVEPLRVVVLAVRTIFTSREKADLAGPIGIARVVATSPTEGARIAATATAMWNTALCLLSMVVALALVPRGALKAKAT